MAQTRFVTTMSPIFGRRYLVAAVFITGPAAPSCTQAAVLDRYHNNLLIELPYDDTKIVFNTRYSILALQV